MPKPQNIIDGDKFSTASSVPFQFEDVRKLANQILKRATVQADNKLKSAQKQAGDIEQAAYDDGHKEGFAKGKEDGHAQGRQEGEAAGRAEYQDRTGPTVELLAGLLGELQQRKVALQAEAEADLLRLSMALAERIVRRTIELDPEAILPMVREAIGLANDRSDLIIHVNPADLMALEEELPALRTAFTDLGKVHLEADDGIGRGGLRLQHREGEIDMRLEEQLTIFRRALLGETGDTRPDLPPATLAPSAELPAPTAMSGMMDDPDNPELPPQPPADSDESDA